MNNLSWLIYLGGVSGSLAVILVLTAITLVAITSVFVLYGATKKEYENQTDPEWIMGHDLQAKALKKIFPWSLVCLVLFAFMPSQNTVYAIAASELGEKALNTPIAAKTAKAIEAWLDKQIAVGGDKERKEE